MNHQPTPDDAAKREPPQDFDFMEQACSAEFSQGCAEPMVDISPIVTPQSAPKDPERTRARPVVADAGDEEIVEVPDAVESDRTDAGFPDAACSAEFPKGCVEPAHEDTHP